MLKGYVKKSKPAPWTSTPAGKLATAQAQLRLVRHMGRCFGKLKLDKLCKPQRRKLVARVSKRYRSEKALYRQEASAFVAAAVARGGTCPVFEAVPSLKKQWKYGHPLSNKLNDVHHTRGRGRGGRGPLLRDQRFWIAVSVQGHRWLHSNIEEARALGFFCAKGLWNVPHRAGRCIQCGYRIDPSCELCGECACETEGND